MAKFGFKKATATQVETLAIRFNREYVFCPDGFTRTYAKEGDVMTFEKHIALRYVGKEDSPAEIVEGVTPGTPEPSETKIVEPKEGAPKKRGPKGKK